LSRVIRKQLAFMSRHDNHSAAATPDSHPDCRAAAIQIAALHGILDRLVHNAHRIELKGESMRRRAARRATPVDVGEET